MEQKPYQNKWKKRTYTHQFDELNQNEFKEDEYRQIRPHQSANFQSLLEVAAKRFKFDRQFRAIRVCQEFRNVLPKFISGTDSSKVFPISYHDNTLVIGVIDSSWAQVVTMNKDSILKAINQALGKDHIEKVTVRITTEPLKFS